MNLLNKLWYDVRIRKLVRYGFFGVCTTLVNFLMFRLLKDILFIEINISNTIAIITSILFAYVTNKVFVFRSKTPTAKAQLREIISFFSARGVTMLLEIAGVFLVHTLLKVDESYSYYTKASLNVIVLVLNFVFSQWFVFKNNK